MKPILFLGGAPKAGTSYLFDLLAQHPNICPSQPKETFYFMDAAYPLSQPKHNYFQDGLASFQQFFSIEEKTQYLLEGSTHLLYQKDIIPVIAALDVQVLFVLREPAQRLQSAFEYTQNRGAILRKEIPFESYATALLNGERAEIDAWVRPNVSHHFLKEELSFSSYCTHLKPWLEALGKERVQVLQFEELKQNASTTVKTIFQILGLPDYGINAQIAQHNTYQIQNKYLHYYIRQLNKIVPKNQVRNQLRDLYFRLQKRPLVRDSSDASLVALKAYFQAYNQELANLVDIDLELWS